MRLQTILALGLGLVLAGALMAGCDSESVTPNDQLPVLSQSDAASQAGFLAMAISTVGNEFAGFEETAKNLYSYTFAAESSIQGVVYFTFLAGGADGQQAPYDQADWAHVATGMGEALTIAIGELPAAIAMTMDMVADPYDPVNRTATLSGAGTLTAGENSSVWSIDAVAVDADGFPGDGTMTFEAGDITVVVHFDGDSEASVTVDGVEIGTIDLGSGVFEEITP